LSGPLLYVDALSPSKQVPNTMSSKRGRKRNDNLPPNRARDVQRAFRARRAAHLQALEERVSELEEENSCLRQALNLPQANRPPLGKGPTGKDKPKSFDNHGRPLTSSRDSSSADSPGSMRGDSLSPVLISATLPPRAAVQEIENGTGPWGQTIVMTEEVPQYRLPSPPRGLGDHSAHSPHELHGHHSQHDLHSHHRPAYTPDGRIIT